ncbi:DUF3048 domain-containing protein [Blastococcus sp. TF02A-26]|uniref:DUF3048 domain-containing protein n=1 Tax=Blastococcus sp. TF02A-26 TaxID=2250577 RepID=UPI000DE9C0AE|nr:DUF3048 domain-containing protein [Blastococcus sp. TF02A-26]RBY85076.1 DUF3048 domain-containing protein [Blastococcus sp. TF02A-26]
MPSRTAPARRPSGGGFRRAVSAAVAGFLLAAAVTCATDDGSAPEQVPGAWPLTGVDAGGADTARPALAVKVENSDAARPQTGLNAADVVWEQVVEGGISRFVAVYHSTLPPTLGPVRSVRPMDAPIAAPLRGLLAFSGGQAPFIDAARAAGLQVVQPDSGPGFFRTGDRVAPHNTYVDPAALLGQADAEHQGPPPTQFWFGADATAVADGEPTGALGLALSAIAEPRWEWSGGDGAWLRSEGTVPALEADGARMRATNVVVLRVDLVDTAFTDSAGTAVPETVLVGDGEALVATGGHTVEAEWSKESVGDPVVLTLPGGDPVVLAPGSTWVELVPNGSGSVTVG